MVSVALSAAFLIFMEQILTVMGTSVDTYEYSKSCLTIVTFSGSFVLIVNSYSNVIRAEGQAGKAVMGQLMGNLLYVILDPIKRERNSKEAIGTRSSVAPSSVYTPFFMEGKMKVLELARVCELSKPTVYKYLKMMG